MSDTTPGPWGPWHDHIGEGLAHCADYLGRLQRCLAGEIAPDRHYFGTKARALRDASVGLLRRARDVERWLGACDADYEDAGGAVGSCGLPAGHAGDHDEGPTPAERLAERADALAAVATEVADTLGWASVALDTGHDSPEVVDALDEAARRLGELRRGAGELAAQVAAVGSRH